MPVSVWPLRQLAYPRPLNPRGLLGHGVLAAWVVLPRTAGGLRWLDLTGRNHGTLTSLLPSSDVSGWGATTRPGGYGELRFPNTGIGAVAIGNSSAYNDATTTARTVVAWFKQTQMDLESEQRILTMCRDVGSTGWGLYTDNYGAGPCRLAGLYKQAGNVLAFCYGTTTIALNSWYMGAFVITGVNGTLYLNGKAEGTVSDIDTTTSFTSGAFPCEIGHFPGAGTAYWVGSLDGVLIFNYALTPAALAQLFTVTRHRSLRLLTWPAAPPAVRLVSTPPRRPPWRIWRKRL
jgi:hypothetical protein